MREFDDSGSGIWIVIVLKMCIRLVIMQLVRRYQAMLNVSEHSSLVFGHIRMQHCKLFE